MRVVVQRVKEGAVIIGQEQYARIGRGLVILVGIKQGDREADALFLAAKCANLRVFEDQDGKMNIGLRDVQGEALVVSQFTLYGDVQKGNRPSFTDAAPPETARPLYQLFVAKLEAALGEGKVRTGLFGAMMDVCIINDGPVTIIIDSPSPRPGE